MPWHANKFCNDIITRSYSYFGRRVNQNKYINHGQLAKNTVQWVRSLEPARTRSRVVVSLFKPYSSIMNGDAPKNLMCETKNECCRDDSKIIPKKAE